MVNIVNQGSVEYKIVDYSDYEIHFGLIMRTVIS